METIAIATETFPKRDVELARRIHRSLLPRHLVTTRVDIDARYREMNVMGDAHTTLDSLNRRRGLRRPRTIR